MGGDMAPSPQLRLETRVMICHIISMRLHVETLCASTKLTVQKSTSTSSACSSDLLPGLTLMLYTFCHLHLSYSVPMNNLSHSALLAFYN